MATYIVDMTDKKEIAIIVFNNKYCNRKCSVPTARYREDRIRYSSRTKIRVCMLIQYFPVDQYKYINSDIYKELTSVTRTDKNNNKITMIERCNLCVDRYGL